MSIWPVTIGAAFLLSGLVSYALSRYRGPWAVLDEPNQRSLHQVPVPRLGGVAIIIGIVCAFVLGYELSVACPPVLLFPVVCGLVIVVIVSMLDDIHGAPVILRLACHFIAAAFVAFGGLSLTPFWIGEWSRPLPAFVAIGFAILFIAWMINLYNFMDGMDGFAAGMGVIGFGTFSIMGHMAGAPEFAQISASIAAACGGLLLLNFPPAKLFMGDIGAATLGFLAATLTLWANQRGVFPWWVGILVFSPFVMDASWTLLRRIFWGKAPWVAHREHFYQRLVRLGWGHSRTVMSEYGLMLLCAFLAVGLQVTKNLAAQLAGMGFAFLGYVMLGLWVCGLETRKQQGVKSS